MTSIITTFNESSDDEVRFKFSIVVLFIKVLKEIRVLFETSSSYFSSIEDSQKVFYSQIEAGQRPHYPH